MNKLDKMSPELAAKIILIHTNDVIQETHGRLDPLTKELFKVPIPTFTLGNFAYTTGKNNSVTVEIKITYPGIDIKRQIMIHVETVKGVKGVSYRIEYKISHKDRRGIELIKGIPPNWIGTSSIRTDVMSDIFLDSSYYNLGVNKVFINFMEALFLREFLKVRIDRITGGDEEEPFKFISHECSSLLYGLGELLTPQNKNQMKLWKEQS